MSANNIHVFTDADLDGAISYLTLCWYYNRELPVTVTTEKDLLKEIEAFKKKNNITDYKRVYILDLDINKAAANLDHENITIVDHHFGSVNCEYKFTKAKTRIEDSGSTCKLLYKILKEGTKKDLDAGKRILISIGHDYDSYTLKNKELSIGMNMLFWNLQGNRLQKFTERFLKEGFTGLTDDDKKIISFYKNKIVKFINETPIYSGSVTMGSKNVKVCSIMADFCINEIAREIMEKTNSEIAIVINPRTESVSFRRSADCTVNLAKLADKVANGGGHEQAAGGKITPIFLEFTKKLTND